MMESNWLILVLFLLQIIIVIGAGAILYLIIRPKSTKKLPCQSCRPILNMNAVAQEARCRECVKRVIGKVSDVKRCVLYDVYQKLPPEKILKFFTQSERIWSEYLQRQDAFTPDAYAKLQAQYQVILNVLQREI